MARNGVAGNGRRGEAGEVRHGMPSPGCVWRDRAWQAWHGEAAYGLAW